MIPDNLVFIQCVPHDLYFQWQIEVQIVNFRKFRVSDRMQIIVWYPQNSQQISKWIDIQKKYPEVKIFLYPDAGVNLGLYISQLRPHSLKKHFALHEGTLKDKVFFYHDSDILFRELPDFEKLVEGDICWQSDCSHYLDYSYLAAKEKEGNIPDHLAIKKMAEIGGITVEKIKEYDHRTGGAQYILRDLDYKFWESIENQCIAIRTAFSFHIEGSINKTYFTDENKGFQSWCADMWAINFEMWRRGQKTEVTPELDFSWGSDPMTTYLKKPIFHNAGVTAGMPGLFYKGAWINKSPIGQDIPLPAEDKASRVYVEAIKEVK